MDDDEDLDQGEERRPRKLTSTRKAAPKIGAPVRQVAFRRRHKGYAVIDSDGVDTGYKY
jgi:hypothetical protein